MPVHKGDKGTVFELEFRDGEEVDGQVTDKGPLPIGTATEIIFYYKKPNGNVVQKKKSLGEVALSTDGSDGKAKHVGETGFLDVAGVWERMGWVQLSTGAEHWAAPVTFPVNNTFI